MMQLPEFARDRLRRQAPGEHPDADLLTAFAEHALTAAERDRMLSHLAACAACREVVSLAAAEEEQAPVSLVAAAEPAASGWLRWTVLRWGALAAAVVIVFAAVLQLPYFRSTPAGIEVSAPAPPEAAESGVTKAEARAAQPAPEAADKRARAQASSRASRLEDKKAAAKNAPEAVAANTVKLLAPTAAPPPRVKAEAQPAPNLAFQAAELPRPTAPATATVHGGVVGGVAAGVAPPPPQQAETVRVKASVSDVLEVAPPGAQPQQARSADAAKSMMVRKQKAEPPRLTVIQAGVSPMRWRVADDGSLEHLTQTGWERAPMAAGVTFRAVSVVGFEVWAGGSAGALYHSLDMGQTWTKVAVRAGDSKLSGDILRVEFTDALHGKLATSTGERWTTSDGGLTWSKG